MKAFFVRVILLIFFLLVLVVGLYFFLERQPIYLSAFLNQLVTRQKVKLIASNAMPFANFGHDVAIAQDTVAVSALSKEIVYVFDRHEGGVENWGETMKLQSGTSADEEFGYALTMNDTTIMVGAPEANDGEGAVYVFERGLAGTSDWTFTDKLTAGTPSDFAWFGNDLSLENDTLVVGASFYNNSQGTAYVFERQSDGRWVESAQLFAPEPAAHDLFSSFVDISGDYMVIGAYLRENEVENAGSAYIFQKKDGSWQPATELISDRPQSFSWFGKAGAIYHNRIVVGAELESDTASETGNTYFFEQDTETGGLWLLQESLLPMETKAGVRLGHALDITDLFLVVGYGHDDDPNAEVTEGLSNKVLLHELHSNFVAQLKTADGAAGDGFGLSVAIDDETVVVGAPNDNNETGAVYVFELTPSPGVERINQVRLVAMLAFLVVILICILWLRMMRIRR